MRYFVRTVAMILLVFSGFIYAPAQTDTARHIKVAVFAPFYLDDAFDGSTYKLDKNSLPKNILPGLEFYNGVMLAIDSLQKEGVSAEISIYDTKQDPQSLAYIFSNGSLNNTGVIIAAVTNVAELRMLADKAQEKNIPFISATYPNSGNVTGNPYFILLNSSLQAHVEGLYKHLQRNFAAGNIIMLKRKGPVENYIKTLFEDLNKKTFSVPLKMKWVELTDSFATYQVLGRLDTLKQNVVVVASPLESFGLKVVRCINANKAYETIIVGMPTWDAIKELNKSEFKNAEIVYSTPFSYSRTDGLGAILAKKYKAKYYSRPSDMVYKGFETVFHFTKLLIKHGSNFLSNLSDKDFTVFNQFEIVPVKIRTDSSSPDYYENKKLYFVTKQEGQVLSVTSY